MGIYEEWKEQEHQKFVERHERHKQDIKQKFDKIERTDEQLEYVDEFDSDTVCGTFRKDNRKIDICHKTDEKSYTVNYRIDNKYLYRTIEGYRNVAKVKDWFLDKEFTSVSELELLQDEDQQKRIKKKKSNKPIEKTSKKTDFKYHGINPNW